MVKLNPEIRNTSIGHISDENLDKLSLRVENEMDLETTKERILDNIDDNGLFLLSGGITNYFVNPKDKRTKNWRELRKELSFLRRYIYTLGNLPTENFLNSYEEYEQGENSDVIDASQRFLQSDKNPRLLWIHGKPGVGKSHLLCAMLERVIRQQVEWEFNQLQDEDLLLCPPYLNGFDSKMNCPDFSIKKFGGKLYSDKGRRISHARDKYLGNRDIFRLADDYTLFLDDIPIEGNPNSKIMSYLQGMHNNGIGSAVITSNYSMSDWIEENTRLMDGSSPLGLESRLNQFGRVFEIKSDSKREGASW